MAKLALYVALEAKVDKEEEAAEFLRSLLPLAQAEPGTTTWYAVRFDHNTFAIFDALALIQQAPDLFVDPPEIQRLDILACKPHQAG
jgi:quinol monooxygenase YgiN